MGEMAWHGVIRRSHPSPPEQFVPHPWSQEPGARVYRTGDQVRWREEGVLEFLGRQDTQIKLRGYRIELEEVGEVLRQCPVVKEAVVLCREDRPGEKQLVAYVVAAGKMEGSDLRTFLDKRLPEYMIPGGFVMMEALPITPNGKIDKMRLPMPTQILKHLSSKNGPVLLTPLENQLMAIWQQTLGSREISIHDNFFELGGHSLMAANIFSQIEKIYSQKIPLSILFQYPTIHELANVLSEQGWRPSWSSLITIQPHGSLAPFFVVPGVGGNVVGFSTLSHFLGPSQPFYGFQALGLDGNSQPFTTIEKMAAYYIHEMQSLQPSGPYILGGQCIGGVIAFEMGQQLLAQGEQVALLVLMDAWPPRSRYSMLGLFPPVWHELILQHLYPVVFSWNWIIGQCKNGMSIRNIIKSVKHLMGLLGEILKEKKIYAEQKATINMNRVPAANKLAISRYTLKEYPGRTVHFLAKDRKITSSHDPRNTWERFCLGGYQTFEIPASDSGEILRPPGVQELALMLKGLFETVKPAE